MLFFCSQGKLVLKDLSLPVPKPEHIAAMKIFARKKDPSREYQEMADLQFLLGLTGIEKKEIKSYFEKYGLLEKYEELSKKIGLS